MPLKRNPGAVHQPLKAYPMRDGIEAMRQYRTDYDEKTKAFKAQMPMAELTRDALARVLTSVEG